MSYAIQTAVDLASVPPRQPAAVAAVVPTAELAEPAERAAEPTTDWEAEAKRLRAALEDVLALATGSAELRHRFVQMQRRAIAALSGIDGSPRPAPRR